LLVSAPPSASSAPSVFRRDACDETLRFLKTTSLLPALAAAALADEEDSAALDMRVVCG
jgi:hypothetical protein